MFPAFASADTEVIGVIKAAPVPGINIAVATDIGYEIRHNRHPLPLLGNSKEG